RFIVSTSHRRAVLVVLAADISAPLLVVRDSLGRKWPPRKRCGSQYGSRMVHAGIEQMLAKPFCCGSCRERKLVEIGIEMATRYQGEPFGLQRTLISCKRQIGDSELVVTRDNQQQRCWRNARYPDAWFVHARGPRRAQGDLVFPEACWKGLKIKIDSVLGAVGGSNRGI